MFRLTQLVVQVKRSAPLFRSMSASAGPLVDVSDNEGIAVMTLQRPPVNSLNLDLLQAMNASFIDIAKNKPKGMILTSSSPTVFTAGLDIMEMYKPDMKRAELFGTAMQDVWIKLFTFNFATAAAINGHAPGGGCVLAMSCEYRVMVSGKYTIGLNETGLGVVATLWSMDTMCHTIHKRDAELALTTGKLFTAEEALKVGLIDEQATDKADCIEKCKKFINRFDGISHLARMTTKQRIRQDLLQRMQNMRHQDTTEFLESLKNPQVQQGLEMYISSLKQKANSS